MDRASIVATAAASLLGLAYFIYLRIAPFPPDMARLAPFFWLAMSLWAAGRGVRGIIGQPTGAAGWAVVIVAVLNTTIAVVFCLAAAMGD